MTEITVDNFQDMLPSIEEAIKESSFLAIDTEMTGLHFSPSLQPSLFDSVRDRYGKLRESVSNFIICQFGLSCFKKDIFSNQYESKSYTFYLCPKYSGANREKAFAIDPGSLEFLCDFHFDFSKFAYKSIPYLNKNQEEQLREEMSNGVSIEIPNTVANEFQRICSEVTTWITSLEKIKPKGDEEIRIRFAPTINEFVNYLLLFELRKTYKNVWFEMCEDVITASLTTQEERLTLISRNVEDQQDALLYILGFSTVFKCIVESNKPIVGYNMISDILMMYHHFYEPLPKKLDVFKKRFTELFSLVYDAKSIVVNCKKHLGHINQLYRAQNLLEVYQYMSSNDFKLQFLYQPTIREATSAYHIDGETILIPHNAGFDSYITGYCFIRLAHALTMLNNNNVIKTAPSWLHLQRSVSEYKNRINLILCNTHYLNLEGRDSQSDRPEWLHIKSLEKKPIVLSNVMSVVSSYGMVDVRLTTRYEALLAVSHHRAAQDIIKALRNGSEYKVAKYSAVKHNKRVRFLLWTSLVPWCCLTLVMTYKFIKNV